MVAAAKLLRLAGRRRAGRFLAEGPNLVEAATRAGVVTEVFATEAAAVRHAEVIGGATVHVVTERAAKALSDTVTPTGLVAVCETPTPTLPGVLPGAALIAVAVGVSEPGNAGTLIRLGHAMGADAVVLAGHSVDPYNGKCLRASTGSIFAVPVVVEPDTDAVIAALQGAGLRVLATALDGEIDLAQADLAGPTAWLFGPEAHGLPAEVAGAADQRVRIEMPGDAESLNVGAAAAICLYQSARARAVGRASR
ncbi:TrmH family RNA methyltransferase [Mycolicibacterium sp.]|uniref:TrmH family RNA methyltransferase n=1 Tax=Mycolicibacterium sp. TaxID=2320850 RepID=UPI00356080C5